MADKATDALYDRLRGRWTTAARANGYQLDAFFRAEQATVLGAVAPGLEPIVDVACGSGLMTLPLLAAGRSVWGIDFNVDACAHAHARGLTMVRGDAMALPFADASIGQIINCQFLNQQDASATRRFLAESARVLYPGGRLLLTWRHARSGLHRAASWWLRLRRDPAAAFPQFEHPLDETRDQAAELGLQAERCEVTWPLRRASNMAPDARLANLLGASFFAVMTRDHDADS